MTTAKRTAGKIRIGRSSASSDSLFASNDACIAIFAGDSNVVNAAHAAACWNACDGVNPEAVPMLVEALKPFADLYGDLSEIGGGTIVWPAIELRLVKNAKAALAKAREGQ